MSDPAVEGGAARIIGREVEVDVGPIAHGGHCVARVHDDGDAGAGRVLFVRHALPGERVRARVTEGREADAYWRADAVEVLRASPDRVSPPCPWAGPGRCGGCDLQHVAVPAQRALKAAVVREQLSRLAGLDVDVEVEAVAVPGRGDGPADDPEPVDGLRWRTRVHFAVDPSGRAGLRGHRSHDVVPVDGCLIASAGADDADVPRRRWTGASGVDVVAPHADGDELAQRLLVITPVPGSSKRPRVPDVAPEDSVAIAPVPPAPRRGRSRPSAGGDTALERVRGRTWVREVVGGVDALDPMDFRVTGTGFWQVHAGAATALTTAVLAALDPAPGERALDLYAGSGLFTAALAQRVGSSGSVTAVEGDARAVADARRSLRQHDHVSLVHAPVDAASLQERGPGGDEGTAAGRDGVGADANGSTGSVDVVVLDPPRSGARREAVEAIAALGPRAIAYVACDPAALARDVAMFAQHGYVLEGLRAFDIFPMTHHVECVARLVPATA